MDNEQLSFLEPRETAEIKHELYDATICSRCFCSRCKYSVEIFPCLSDEECRKIKNDSCFNCDECYYYGMDNEKLSRNVVKFKCNKFEMSNYYKQYVAYHEELVAKRKRKSFKIIHS